MTIPTFTWSYLGPILPELVLICIGIAVILIDLFASEQEDMLPWLTVIGILTTMVVVAGQAPGTTFEGMYVADGYALFFKFICLLGLLLTTLMSEQYLKARNLARGEYYSLLIFSSVGMMIMVSAGDLMVLYVGLELMALSIYCLVGLMKQDGKSSEAALKYFLMGAFFSAILLYGISLVYGMTGTTNLHEIAVYTVKSIPTTNPALLAGLGLMTAAFCFKTAVAPFHFWTPDVYEGAPTSITAYMSVGAKAASFAVFGRVLMIGFPELQANWGVLLSFFALLTMAVGNITALAQTNIKRMLAYSSIAHAGYALIGILAGTAEGLSATMNYLLIYGFMNMGAFAVLVLMASDGKKRESLEDYKGLAKNNPAAAALMLIFMFSLTGIPPTAGFIGKFYLLKAGIQAGYTWLVIAAVVFSSISAFFYLRVVRYMYMEEATEETKYPFTPGLTAAITLALIGVIGLGLMPGSVVGLASKALVTF